MEIDTCQDVLECELDVAGIKGGGFDEGQAVLGWNNVSISDRKEEEGKSLPANAFASSVGTARRCLKSLLFPTSMMTMLLSA